MHELMGPTVTKVIQTQVQSFHEALALFQAGDLAKARAGFEGTKAKMGGNDGPSDFYLREIAKLEKSGLPEKWNGTLVIDSK